MAKVPGFAKAFAGRWRIVEMDNWDSDFLDLVEEAHLTFEGKSDGEIVFGALKGFLDVRYGARNDRPGRSRLRRLNPGTDPAKITELAKEGAVLWRKHGGKVTYWTVAVGEVGNRVLSITFENFAAYGAAVDKMGEDKEVRAWQAKRMKAGYTTWVRSNMATEIEI